MCIGMYISAVSAWCRQHRKVSRAQPKSMKRMKLCVQGILLLLLLLPLIHTYSRGMRERKGIIMVHDFYRVVFVRTALLQRYHHQHSHRHQPREKTGENSGVAVVVCNLFFFSEHYTRREAICATTYKYKVVALVLMSENKLVCIMNLVTMMMIMVIVMAMWWYKVG